MKKDKLKKILATGAMGIMALAMPFAITGCDKDSDINVRVEGEYIQWQVDGSDSWTNLLSVEEVKELLGESYKGDTGAQGNPGINGKEVEFRKTETHIQWRYADNSQEEDENWEDLVLLSSLKGESGQNGSNGTDGKTPFIGTNGNWWIGETDTGVNAEAQDGHTPTITISADGYWIINNVKTEHKAIGNDADEWTIGDDGFWYKNGFVTEFRAVVNQVHKITFDYNFFDEYEMELIFENYKKTEDLEVTNWIVNMPTPNEDNIDSFDGWFIEGTDKKIENYDFIGGDVTLVAKWNKNPTIPSGIYQDRKRLYTWSEFVDSYQVGSGYTALNGLQNYGIVIDDSVVSVGEDQFRGETGLSSVIIGQGVVNVGMSAFSDCSNLKSVIIGASVESIGVDAFKDTALEEIVVPGNVKSIGNGAFSGCNSLNNVKLENGVEQLNGLVFSNCENLKNITIPDSLTNLSYTDFNGCINLEKFDVGENNQNYFSVDGVLYNKQQSELIKCPATKTGHFYIPQSVEKIVTNAFSGSQLTHIYADSDNLKVIEYGAFNGCEKLVELRFEVNSSWVLEPEFSGETATMNVVEYGYTAIINGQSKDIAQQWLDIYSSYNWNKEVESN